MTANASTSTRGRPAVPSTRISSVWVPTEAPALGENHFAILRARGEQVDGRNFDTIYPNLGLAIFLILGCNPGNATTREGDLCLGPLNFSVLQTPRTPNL